MELPYHLLRAQGPPTVSAWNMLMCVVKNVNSSFSDPSVYQGQGDRALLSTDLTPGWFSLHLFA